MSHSSSRNDRSFDADAAAATAPGARDRSHWLYLAVVLAVIAGIIVGIVDKDLGVALKPLGTVLHH